MLKFLHISDLHITTEDAGTQFDRDVKIREELIKDLGKGGRKEFSGIFVTGDIAYNGKAAEFARAKAWLEELRKAAMSPPEAIFIIPGNHDVNRSAVAPDSSLWELHQALRKMNNTAARVASLDKKLHDSFDFLTALSEYRAFVLDYDCATNPKELAWVQVLGPEQTLDDGSSIRIHGLNSALLSDGEDMKANLLLSPSQFHHFGSDPGYVNIVMCHHPQTWFLDGNSADDHFREQAQVVLFGHEHDNRCYRQGGSVRVFAGAIHPNPREDHWKPCYHILTLRIETAAKRELVVRVETRAWMDKEKCFGQEMHKDLPYFEDRLELKPWTKTPTSSFQVATSAPGEDTLDAAQPSKVDNSGTSDAMLAARRKLIVHFFRLGTIDRYQAVIDAGVWEDSDDAYTGQARWARIFERVEKNSKFSQLWAAVASKDEALRSQPNPFTP